jgi:uncharacterized protein involved in cysteine biosynthesis
MRTILTALILFYLFSLVAGYIVASNCGDLASGYFDTVADALERVNR